MAEPQRISAICRHVAGAVKVLSRSLIPSLRPTAEHCLSVTGLAFAAARHTTKRLANAGILRARISIPHFFSILGILRAPLCVSIVSYIVLSLPAQTHEIYLIHARSVQEMWLQTALGAASLLVLCVLMGHICFELIHKSSTERHTMRSFAACALPPLIAILPLLGMAHGMQAAVTSATTPIAQHSLETFRVLSSEKELKETVDGLQEFLTNRKNPIAMKLKTDPESVAQLGIALRKLMPLELSEATETIGRLHVRIYAAIAVCLMISLAIFASFWIKQAKTIASTRGVITRRRPQWVLYFAYCFLVGVFAAQSLNAGRQLAFDFTAISRNFGPVFLLNVWLIFLLFFCSLLTRAQARHKVPFLSVLAVSAIVASLLNLNDNHAVRFIDVADPNGNKHAAPYRPRPQLGPSFIAWLNSRPPEHVQKFNNRPYPVYVVAAQGGGIYAANLSGLFLARLYDRCPAIRHHLFAVSAVSGGSVGAGFLAGLLNQPDVLPPNDSCQLGTGQAEPIKGPIERKMERLLQTDFLSPAIAGLLFPDFLQRLIPYPIDSFDRARAFEAAVEQAWTSVVGTSPNPLREPFMEHWKANGSGPMLMLNTTVVETGRQLAISPVELSGVGWSSRVGSFHSVYRIPETRDLPLSTAMGLSARFPLIMPAGLVNTPFGTNRLVDGGYFENSGVETAMDMVGQLRESLCTSAETAECVEKTTAPGVKPRLFRFHIFVLTDYDYFLGLPPRRDADGLNELLSPLRAMLNARDARGQLAVTRIPDSIVQHNIVLSHRIYGLPLGWWISHDLQGIISAQIGDPATCAYFQDNGKLEETIDSVQNLETGIELMNAERTGRKLLPPRFVDTIASILPRMAGGHCAMHEALHDDLAAPLNPR
ncbi:hypothetical protein [Agrobacterium tumefaciens]|uniref:hypothetical protein n=1 Tax=Agrobacterium tumefaciens TaxID=358 RepID=UPI001572F052|nr:hypothetical protein [Agrobacterium tumefaciens]